MTKGEKKGICVVCEDLEENRKLFQGILESLGLDVRSAVNGRLGVELVESLRNQGVAVDAIFLDMMMPEMGGVAAAKQLRTSGYAGPILAFSADVSASTTQKAAAAGVSHYFLKTTFTRDLARALLEKYSTLELSD